MAETLLSGWWKRLRGRLEPEPCPYSVAGVLETPLRRFVASPERVLGAFGLSTGQTARRSVLASATTPSKQRGGWARTDG